MHVWVPSPPNSCTSTRSSPSTTTRYSPSASVNRRPHIMVCASTMSTVK
jgi:hypothetical protein